MTPAEAIYLLSAATSLVAAALLLRQYWRSRTALLFWSFVGFVGLAVNNVLVYVDLVLVPDIDLVLIRILAGAAGLMAMLYGLLTETRG
jgi:hypothetical protein